jgi:lysophospholipase L1-like esterase
VPVAQAGSGVAGSGGGDVGQAGSGVGGAGNTAPLAGSGGDMMGGDAGDSGGAGMPATEECMMGVVGPSQVVFIGDSYPASGATAGGIGGIQRQIEKRAVEAGVLAEGEHYRNYYVGGTRFLNDTIQNQWTMAKQQDPDIKVVLMDGGGNDVLQGQEGCFVFNNPMDQVCIDVVERSTAAAGALMEQMEQDGVADIIYFFYPEVPLAPGHSEFDEPYAREGCESFTGALDCHFVSTLAAFEGHAEYIAGDGIHPTAAGQVVIGDLMWESMVANCVAQ